MEWSEPAEGRKYLRQRRGSTWYVWISAKKKWSLQTTDYDEACKAYDRQDLGQTRPRDGSIRCAEAWTKFMSVKKLRPATYDRWQGIWENWAKRELGTMRVAEVEPEDIVRVYRRMERAGISHANAHRALSSFFKVCSEMPFRFRPDNPCRYVGEAWKPDRSGGNIDEELVVLSNETIESLAQIASEYGNPSRQDEYITRYVVAAIIRLMPLFGCRISEMLGLKLTDLKMHTKDPNRRFGEVHVERQRAYKAQALLPDTWYSQTKNGKRKIGSERRSITVTAEAEAILVEYIDRGIREGWLKPGGILFPNSVGRIRPANQVIRYVTKAHLSLGTGVTGTHCFRHTAASNWIAAGMPIERVATLLGDTIETVIDCYGHLVDRTQMNAENELWMTRYPSADTQSIPKAPIDQASRVVSLAQAAGSRGRR